FGTGAAAPSAARAGWAAPRAVFRCSVRWWPASRGELRLGSIDGVAAVPVAMPAIAVADCGNLSAVPGSVGWRSDGRDKPGHDENDAIGIVPYMLTMSFAVCTSRNSSVAWSSTDSAPVATPK